eukprot:TRINITY_DN92_c0_g1_i2.p1 TRINITY_DN92_c0_g1~~TRINITY_DN92_c0_g1_i2.p1  ORF type:complete len:188 (-),score=22.31 TRINITY_DN92_c0_g1_i2:2126-2689(-)
MANNFSLKSADSNLFISPLLPRPSQSSHSATHTLPSPPRPLRFLRYALSSAFTTASCEPKRCELNEPKDATILPSKYNLSSTLMHCQPSSAPLPLHGALSPALPVGPVPSPPPPIAASLSPPVAFSSAPLPFRGAHPPSLTEAPVPMTLPLPHPSPAPLPLSAPSCLSYPFPYLPLLSLLHGPSIFP